MISSRERDRLDVTVGAKVVVSSIFTVMLRGVMNQKWDWILLWLLLLTVVFALQHVGTVCLFRIAARRVLSGGVCVVWADF